jgi:hypothetical protein
MALQSPTAQHLRQLAEAHRFELGEDELAAFQSLLPGIFTALDSLDQAPSNLPPLGNAVRRLTGICVCSLKNIESRPRSSTALAKSTTERP